MNTIRSSLALLLLLSAAFLFSGCRRSAGELAPDRHAVTILYTNDIHSHLEPDAEGRGGLARIGGYLDRVRKEHPEALYLDAGDGVTGTPISSIFRGTPVFEVLNAMGCDAAALGNHEFDYGSARIAEFRRIAEFPILCANAAGPDGKPLADAPWKRFLVNGVRVGVIGLLTDSTPAVSSPGGTEGCTFLPPAAALRALLPEVERESDLVVVLSHLGVDADRALAAQVSGIDLVVGGHSHTVIRKPEVVHGVRIVQAGCNGRYVGRLCATVDLAAGRVVSVEDELVPVTADLPESDAVGRVVAECEEKVRARVDVTIGEVRRGYDAKELRGPIERIYRSVLSCDVGFQNPGGTRAGLPAGKVRVRDVWNALPFENTLVIVRVRGAKLPPWARERLAKVEPDRIYTIATNSFVTEHPEIYFPEGMEGSVDSGRPMRGTVIDWIRKHGGL